MVGVDARVEHAHHDRRVAGRDGVRLGDVDLLHVPLRAPQGSAVGSPVASTAAVSTASTTSSSMSVVPSPSVEATDSTPAPATAPANAVLVDRATSTPIWS